MILSNAPLLVFFTNNPPAPVGADEIIPTDYLYRQQIRYQL